jgi:hypothetical protein
MRFRSLPTTPVEWLAGWMLAAWFIGLSVTIPLYTSYPRLALPWHVATWLGAGVLVSLLTSRLVSPAAAAGVSFLGVDGGNVCRNQLAHNSDDDGLLSTAAPSG